MSVQKTILSVDWDFCFILNEIDNDYSAHESPLFIETLWNIRSISAMAGYNKTIEEQIPQWITPDDFCNMLEKKDLLYDKDIRVAFSESHSSLLPFVENLQQDLQCSTEVHLINFDSHSDIIGSDNTKMLELENVDCGNWATFLLEQKLINKYTLVFPDWRKEDFKEQEKGYDTIFYSDFVKDFDTSNIEIVGTFACRSGAWVPPQYDDNFIMLITQLISGNMDRVDIYGDRYSPFKTRDFLSEKEIKKEAIKMKDLAQPSQKILND